MVKHSSSLMGGAFVLALWVVLDFVWLWKVVGWWGWLGLHGDRLTILLKKPLWGSLLSLTWALFGFYYIRFSKNCVCIIVLIYSCFVYNSHPLSVSTQKIYLLTTTQAGWLKKDREMFSVLAGPCSNSMWEWLVWCKYQWCWSLKLHIQSNLQVGFCSNLMGSIVKFSLLFFSEIMRVLDFLAA